MYGPPITNKASILFMNKLLRFFKPYLGYIAILVLVAYLQVTATLMLPDYIASIVDKGIMAKDMNQVYQNGVMMLLLTLLVGVLAAIAGFLAAKIATGAARDIRLAIFTRVESFSINEFDTFSTASLITRSTNDIQQIQMTTIMMFRMMLLAPFMAVIGFQKAISNAPSMGWIIGAAVVALIAMIVVIFAIGVPKFKLLQKMIDKLNLVTRENLTGLRVVRAYNNEVKEEQKFDQANQDLTKLNLFTNRLMVIMQPMMMLIMNLSVLAIVWFGAGLINDNTIQIGNMLAFMQYAMQVIWSFLMISIVFILFPRASVSANRVAEVLAAKPTIVDPVKPIAPSKDGVGKIEFKNVSFAYPNAEVPVLKDISFVAEAGKTTAFIGSTGSGKTTLVNLIPRFYDATGGEILIDGVNVRDMKQKDLRKMLGYAPQKSVLFSGTVQSNIKYGNKNANETQVKKAAEIAQATQFIKKLAKQFDNEIAQGGANVSGGQKQRLSIARAIAVHPKIYLFDDSFSSLDFKTDAALRQALHDNLNDKTVLIVGQRIGTIADADNIIVLNEGKIVGQGTHSELIKSNSVYREIAKSQLSDEELNSLKLASGDQS